MTKLILSTGNIMGGGSTILRPTNVKSNTELVSSLRSTFHASSTSPTDSGYASTNGDSILPNTNYKSWTRSVTSKEGSVLEVPTLNFSASALQEEHEAYDITLKLFYLPGATASKRKQQTHEALDLVLEQLHVPNVDLLIVSFPGIYFDEEEDCPGKISTRGPVEAQPEPLGSQIEAWRVLEELHEEGLVKKLGIAEFGKDRLELFLEQTRIRPSVNQINLRDCCSVPKPLMALAKSKSVELLVHNDCSNILPRGTVRELLGSSLDGAGVLAEADKNGGKRKSLHGEIGVGEGLQGEVQPQWVVKYTAVVKNRGVVENKGYFAIAEVGQMPVSSEA